MLLSHDHRYSPSPTSNSVCAARCQVVWSVASPSTHWAAAPATTADSAVRCFSASLFPQWATLSQACTTLATACRAVATVVRLTLINIHRRVMTASPHCLSSFSEVSVYRFARYFRPRYDPIPLLKYRPRFDTDPIFVLPLHQSHAISGCNEADITRSRHGSCVDGCSSSEWQRLVR